MPQEEHSDEALLAATAKRPSAFGPVYERHAPAVLAYLRRRTGSTEVAIDLTAEVFAAALEAAPRFRAGEAPVRAWLIGIANHKLVDSRRRARASRDALQRLGIRSVDLSDAEIAEIDQRLTEQADGALAMRLVADLPAEQREAVLARVVDDEEYRDLALRFNTTEANVRARVHRGLRRLGTLMSRPQEQ